MANIYWIKGGANAAWSTVTDNWWDDAAGTVQASAVPQNGDSIYFKGATAPADDGISITYLSIDTSQLTDDFTFTNDITLSGSLVLGVPGSADVHTWGGDASDVDNCLIQGASEVTGSIGSDATFRDTAYVTGTIGPRARFFDDTEAGAGTFSTSVYCYGNNYFYAIDGDLTLTGVTFYVHRFLTLGIAGHSIIGTPTVIAMNRNANSGIHILGAATANVVLWRPAQAHRLRHIG